MSEWVSYLRVEADEDVLVALLLELRQRFGRDCVRSRTLLRFLDEAATKPPTPVLPHILAVYQGPHGRLRQRRNQGTS